MYALMEVLIPPLPKKSNRNWPNISIRGHPDRNGVITILIAAFMSNILYFSSVESVCSLAL